MKKCLNPFWKHCVFCLTQPIQDGQEKISGLCTIGSCLDARSTDRQGSKPSNFNISWGNPSCWPQCTNPLHQAMTGNRMTEDKKYITIINKNLKCNFSEWWTSQWSRTLRGVKGTANMSVWSWRGRWLIEGPRHSDYLFLAGLSVTHVDFISGQADRELLGLLCP